VVQRPGTDRRGMWRRTQNLTHSHQVWRLKQS
jgi:hypothetical protein